MLYRLRRRRIHINYYFRPLPKGAKAVIILIVIISLLLISLSICLVRVRPIIADLAEAEVTDVVLSSINEAVNEAVLNGSLAYDRLVTLNKDSNGNITAVVTNMAAVNSLKTVLSDAVLEKVAEKITTDVSIPLGNIIGGALFSGRGPSIPVKIVSIANEDINFFNEFSSAGINQTHHRIFMEIAVDIVLLIPGGTTSTTVQSHLVIAETVIVGVVPDVYAGWGGN